MSAMDKEKIFEKLRSYHTDEFPAKIKNSQVEDLKLKFNDVEDRIVSMILSTVSGKAEYIDSTKELDSFQSNLNSIVTTGVDETQKVMFVSKINKLSEIMIMVKDSDFRLHRSAGKVIQV